MSQLDRPRRYVRKPLSVEFRVRDADDTVGGEILFDAVDISEGGAFLRSDYLLEEGDRIEVSFMLPAPVQRPVVVRARVAWVTRRSELKGEPGMGLEFVDLTPAERDAIAEFVASHSQPGRHTP